MWVKTDMWNSFLITIYDFPPNAPDWTIFGGCALFKHGPELLPIPICGHPWGLAPVHWFSVWFCHDFSRYPSVLLAIFPILLYLSCETLPEGRDSMERTSFPPLDRVSHAYCVETSCSLPCLWLHMSCSTPPWSDHIPQGDPSLLSFRQVDKTQQ